ncbi:MAG: lamin tail domain-containing protein [Myxococcota bacterium]|nr:lamin tail domain-containing protein [Myxococcota bacterium]
MKTTDCSPSLVELRLRAQLRLAVPLLSALQLFACSGAEQGGAEPSTWTLVDMGSAVIDGGVISPPAALNSAVLINEIAAKGEPEDWVELINVGATSVSLDGWSLSDDPAELERVPLPLGLTIAPGGLLWLTVSEESLGFKLGSAETLSLYQPDGARADQLSWVDGDSPEGASYGRLPDGGETLETLSPTPGARNQRVAGPLCGDLLCDVQESSVSCPEDCPPIETRCGDGLCDEGEEVGTCPEDCAPVASCGDGRCDATEDMESCPQDCEALEALCGDGRCEAGMEDAARCPLDCPRPPLGLIVLNELSAGGAPDWVELYNRGERAIDLGGWGLSDNFQRPRRAIFPAGTRIEARSYLQILISEESVGFRLGSEEELALYDEAGRLVDFIDWRQGDTPMNGSFGRVPDGVGAWVSLIESTPGESNGGEQPPLEEAPLQLSELDPAGEPEDWFELMNRSGHQIELSGWGITDAPESYPEGAFIFDESFILEAGGYLVIEATGDEGLVGVAPFRLGRNDQLALFNPAGELIELVEWQAEQLVEGASWGLLGEGGEWGPTQSTRGGENIPLD